jgi:DNA excision repair protein ERCC-4
MSTLLPFHKAVLERIHDPSTSDLLVLARGLGLRRIVCTLMKIYDTPQNLVLLVNATQEEESEIGEELGIMGCRKPGLRVVGYETGSKDRLVVLCSSRHHLQSSMLMKPGKNCTGTEG